MVRLRLSSRTRTTASLAALVLTFIVLAGVSLLWQAHETNANQAAQRRAGQVVERKLCADLSTMAAIKPPVGKASTNPSRAYEQAEHRAWQGLVVAIGCKETP